MRRVSVFTTRRSLVSALTAASSTLPRWCSSSTSSSSSANEPQRLSPDEEPTDAFEHMRPFHKFASNAGDSINEAVQGGNDGGLLHTYQQMKSGEKPALGKRSAMKKTAFEETFVPPTEQLATDSERANEPQPQKYKLEKSEMEKWFPKLDANYNGVDLEKNVLLSAEKTVFEGMKVPEVKEAPSPKKDWIQPDDDMFYNNPHMLKTGEDTSDPINTQLPVPPAFDPRLDMVDADDAIDYGGVHDLMNSVELDKRMIEAFGNPTTVEDTIQYLMQPNRETEEARLQRQDFNGFNHWILLQSADLMITEQDDCAQAHNLVNQYMRDMDLFVKWLDHPKVNAHFQKKFNIQMKGRYDRLVGNSVALYMRSKVYVYEGNAPEAMKALTGCLSTLNEGGDLVRNKRHQKLYGAAMAARGMVYCKMESYERCVSDITKAMRFLPTHRAPLLYQIRAEAYEKLGRLDEARADELTAADIWEKAEVIQEGMLGEPRKYVIG